MLSERDSKRESMKPRRRANAFIVQRPMRTRHKRHREHEFWIARRRLSLLLRVRVGDDLEGVAAQ
jgi:hypothetical protein